MKVRMTTVLDKELANALFDVLNDDNGLRNYVTEVLLKQVRPDEVATYVRGVTALGMFTAQLGFQLRRKPRPFDFAALFDEIARKAAEREARDAEGFNFSRGNKT